MNIRILVATHKSARMPNDDLYMPIHCGAYSKNSIGFQRDDSGLNISSMNDRYCELSGLYWGWKNIQADAIGLVHYRRYFSHYPVFVRFLLGKWASIASFSSINNKLSSQYDIIVSKKNFLAYSVYESYSKFPELLIPTDFDIAIRYVSSLGTNYQMATEKVCKRYYAHSYNMFIAKSETLITIVHGYLMYYLMLINK
jgi:hypothetical protein